MKSLNTKRRLQDAVRKGATYIGRTDDSLVRSDTNNLEGAPRRLRTRCKKDFTRKIADFRGLNKITLSE